uniref:Uncharacterized protein n=1 Tax=Arion vulgaris TaxID=1028688 RepID=A0A0B7BYD5_9EUPU
MTTFKFIAGKKNVKTIKKAKPVSFQQLNLTCKNVHRNKRNEQEDPKVSH